MGFLLPYFRVVTIPTGSSVPMPRSPRQIDQCLRHDDVLQSGAGGLVDADAVVEVDGALAEQHRVERGGERLDVDAGRAGGDHVAAAVDDLVDAVDDDERGARDELGGQLALCRRRRADRHDRRVVADPLGLEESATRRAIVRRRGSGRHRAPRAPPSRRRSPARRGCGENDSANDSRFFWVGLKTRTEANCVTSESAVVCDCASKPDPMTPTLSGRFGAIASAPTAVVAAVRRPVTRLPSTSATSSAVSLSNSEIR